MKKLLVFLLGALSAAAQPVTKVRSLDNLLARAPISGEIVLVETGLGTNDWGGIREFKHDTAWVGGTNTGNAFVARNSGYWVAADRTAPHQDVRWFGGNANTKTEASDAALQAAIDYAASPDIGETKIPIAGGSTYAYGLDVYLAPGNWCFNGPIQMRGPTVFGRNAAGTDPNQQTLIWHKSGSTNHLFVVTNALYAGGIRDLRILGARESSYTGQSILSVSNRLQFYVNPAVIPVQPTNGETRFVFFLSPSNTYVGSARILPPDRSTGLISVEPGWDNYASETGLLTTNYKVVFSPTVTTDPPFDATGTRSDPMVAGPVAININQGFNFRINNVDIRLFHAGIRLGANVSLQTDDFLQVDRCSFANMGRAFPGLGSDNQIASVYLTGTYQQDYDAPVDATSYLNAGFRNTLFGWYVLGATDDIGTMKSDRCVYGLYLDRGADTTIGRFLADRSISGGIYVESAPSSPSASSGYVIQDAIIRGTTDTNYLSTNVLRAAITVSTNVTEAFDLAVGTLRIPTFNVFGAYDYAFNIATNGGLLHNVYVGNVLDLSGATNWAATSVGPFVGSGGPTTAASARNGWYRPAHGKSAWARNGVDLLRLNDTLPATGSEAQVFVGDATVGRPGIDIRGGASGTSLLALFTRTGLSTYGLGSANSSFQLWDMTAGEVISSWGRLDTNTVYHWLGRNGQPNNARGAWLYSDFASGTNIPVAGGLRIVSPLGTGDGSVANSAISFYTPTVVTNVPGTGQHTPTLRAQITSNGIVLPTGYGITINNVTRTNWWTDLPWVDVRWFGAVGDGVTDDTAAIQSAIDYALATKRAVKIPVGVFLLQPWSTNSYASNVLVLGYSDYARSVGLYSSTHPTSPYLESPQFGSLQIIGENVSKRNAWLNPTEINNKGSVLLFTNMVGHVGIFSGHHNRGLALKNLTIVGDGYTDPTVAIRHGVGSSKLRLENLSFQHWGTAMAFGDDWTASGHADTHADFNWIEDVQTIAVDTAMRWGNRNAYINHVINCDLNARIVFDNRYTERYAPDQYSPRILVSGGFVAPLTEYGGVLIQGLVHSASGTNVVVTNLTKIVKVRGSDRILTATTNAATIADIEAEMVAIIQGDTAEPAAPHEWGVLRDVYGTTGASDTVHLTAAVNSSVGAGDIIVIAKPAIGLLGDNFDVRGVHFEEAQTEDFGFGPILFRLNAARSANVFNGNHVNLFGLDSIWNRYVPKFVFKGFYPSVQTTLEMADNSFSITYAKAQFDDSQPVTLSRNNWKNQPLMIDSTGVIPDGIALRDEVYYLHSREFGVTGIAEWLGIPAIASELRTSQAVTAPVPLGRRVSAVTSVGVSTELVNSSAAFQAGLMVPVDQTALGWYASDAASPIVATANLTNGTYFASVSSLQNLFPGRVIEFAGAGRNTILDTQTNSGVKGIWLKQALTNSATGVAVTAVSAQWQNATKRSEWGNSIPTTGYHGIGDVVWRTSLGSPGTEAGYICTTAGTPGTWQPFSRYGTNIVLHSGGHLQLSYVTATPSQPAAGYATIYLHSESGVETNVMVRWRDGSTNRIPARVGNGLTNSLGWLHAALDAGTNIVLTTNAQGRISIASTVVSSDPNAITNAVAGANVTITRTNQTITVSASTGSTNSGTPLSVDGILLVDANLADGSEITVTASGTNVTHSLVTTAVTPGSYTSANITVDSKGRITAAANGTGGSGITSIEVNGTAGVTNLVNSPYATWTKTNGTAAVNIAGFEVENSNKYQSTNTVLTRIGGLGAGVSGDIIYRDATGWTNLAKGTDGQVLTLASGFPAWDDPTSGSSSGFGNVVFSVTNDVTVLTAVGTETTILGNVKNGQSKTIPAGSITAGTIYKFDFAGKYTAGGNWTGNQLRAYFGGLTIPFETTTEPHVAAPTAAPFTGELWITFKAVGAIVVPMVSGHVMFQYDAGNAGDKAAMILGTMTVSGSVDTTGNNLFDLTWDNGAEPMDITLTHAILSVPDLASLGSGNSGMLVNGTGTATNLVDSPSGVWARTNGTVALTVPQWTRTITRFTAAQSQPPAANYATFSTRNSIGILQFDPTTQESANFVWSVPDSYAGSTVTIILHCASTATSGNYRFGARIARLTGVDIDSDTYATAVEATTATSGTAGLVTTLTLSAVGLDSAVAGDFVQLNVYRDTGDAADTVNSNDMELIGVEVRAE